MTLQEQLVFLDRESIRLFRESMHVGEDEKKRLRELAKAIDEVRVSLKFLEDIQTIINNHVV